MRPEEANRFIGANLYINHGNYAKCIEANNDRMVFQVTFRPQEVNYSNYRESGSRAYLYYNAVWDNSTIKHSSATKPKTATTYSYKFRSIEV